MTIKAKQLTRAITVVSKPTDDSRVVKFRANSGTVDRHGTIVQPSGIDTKNFEANPVFLWAHQSGGYWMPPEPENVLGRVTEIDRSAEYLDITVEFASNDTNPKAETAFRMVKEGLLNAVSIGFIPVESSTTNVAGKEVYTYTKSELIEVSLVVIPSNPDAVALERSLEPYLAQLTEKFAEQVAELQRQVTELTARDHPEPEAPEPEAPQEEPDLVEQALQRLLHEGVRP